MNRFTRIIGRRRLSCRQVGEVLQAYLDAEVDDLTARRIAHHLEECRRCGMELEVYRTIKSRLARDGEVDREAFDRLRRFGEQLVSDPSTGHSADEGSGG